MLIHNYIKTVNLKLDYAHLTKIVMESLENNKIVDTRKSIGLVENDEYMTKIRDAFPCLSPMYNVLCLKHNQDISIHVDNGRKCTFNVPILNCQNSITTFYEELNDSLYITETSPMGYITYIKNDLKPVYSFTLDKPIIFNTSLPHSVINNSQEDRIILNWSFIQQYSFEEVCEIFNDDAVSALKL